MPCRSQCDVEPAGKLVCQIATVSCTGSARSFVVSCMLTSYYYIRKALRFAFQVIAAQGTRNLTEQSTMSG